MEAHAMESKFLNNEQGPINELNTTIQQSGDTTRSRGGIWILLSLDPTEPIC